MVSGLTTITSLTSATPEGGVIVATVPADGGNFSVAHNIGGIPTCYYNKLTS